MSERLTTAPSIQVKTDLNIRDKKLVIGIQFGTGAALDLEMEKFGMDPVSLNETYNAGGHALTMPLESTHADICKVLGAYFQSMWEQLSKPKEAQEVPV